MATAVGKLNHAKSYLAAAAHLHRSVECGALNLPFPDPISLLLGHSLELVFKACLLHFGATEKDACGHDLIDLRGEAIGKGCKLAVSETELGHLRLLNERFGKAPYEVRYLKTGFATVHSDKIVLQVAERFSLEATALIPGAARY